MKKFKSFSLVFFAFLLLFAFFPVQAFADVVEFQEAAKLGASIVDIYGLANNTNLAYEAVSDGSALTVIQNLYSDYSTSASDPYTLAAIGAAAAAAGTVAVVYDAITGKGYVQLYQTQYVESLDGFWDYTLGDLGLTRNQDGFFEWLFSNDEPVTYPVYEHSTTTFGNITLYKVPVSASLTRLVNDRYYYTGCAVNTISNPSVYVGFGFDGNSTTVYLFSSSSFVGTSYTYSQTRPVDGTTSGSSSVSSVNGIGSGCYFSYTPMSMSSTRPNDVVYFNGAPSSNVSGSSRIITNTQSVVCEPGFYIGDPLTADPVITVPDPASPQYVPSPVRINTGIEWLPEWGNPVPDNGSPEPGVAYPVTDPGILNDAVPGIWSNIVAGTSAEVEPEPEPDPDPEPGNPSEVFIPLLPVAVPSFDFNFVGIWHYVREWVASIGAFLTLLLSVWSTLPWAIVVPVYASLVILIVLGVYRRFFM